MNKYWILYFVFVLVAGLGGPAIDSTSGADSIETISGIVSLVGAGLALIFGLIGTWKGSLSAGLKVLLSTLVLAASVGSVALAALVF